MWVFRSEALLDKSLVTILQLGKRFQSQTVVLVFFLNPALLILSSKSQYQTRRLPSQLITVTEVVIFFCINTKLCCLV